MECFFCKLAQGEIQTKAVYEDAHTFAFLDIHPKSKGHTLVIPKVHADSILSLGDEEIAPLFSMVKQVTKMLEYTLCPDGFTIGINHGTSAGQEVGHIHVHIIPRWNGDKGGSIQSIVNNYSAESLDDIYEKIKKSHT